MNIKLPDQIFPAVVFFPDTPPTNPIIFTVLVYISDYKTPHFVAWFHENRIEPITVYKDGNKWIEKVTNLETINSNAIGRAIENYNPF